MPCTSTVTSNELDFVLALQTRSRALGECRGPLLRLSLWSLRVIVLERIFDSHAAQDVLWGGFEAERIGSRLGSLDFALCGAHWLDLVALVEMRAKQTRCADYRDEGAQLLRDVCQEAGWDAKEIVNMFHWQHALG